MSKCHMGRRARPWRESAGARPRASAANRAPSVLLPAARELPEWGSEKKARLAKPRRSSTGPRAPPAGRAAAGSDEPMSHHPTDAGTAKCTTPVLAWRAPSRISTLRGSALRTKGLDGSIRTEETEDPQAVPEAVPPLRRSAQVHAERDRHRRERFGHPYIDLVPGAGTRAW